MKFTAPHTIALPVVGSVSLFQALGAGVGFGIFEMLFLIGGLWLVGITLFEVETQSIGHGGIFSLSALGFAGCLVWLVEQFGRAHWFLIWLVSVMLVFAVIGYAITLYQHFTRPRPRRGNRTR